MWHYYMFVEVVKLSSDNSVSPNCGKSVIVADAFSIPSYIYIYIVIFLLFIYIYIISNVEFLDRYV